MVSGTEYLLGFVIKPESLADTSCGTEDSARANIKAMPFRIVIDPSRSSWGSRYAPFEAVVQTQPPQLARPPAPFSARQPPPQAPSGGLQLTHQLGPLRSLLRDA